MEPRIDDLAVIFHFENGHTDPLTKFARDRTAFMDYWKDAAGWWNSVGKVRFDADPN